MKAVLRVTGAAVILLTLAGCANQVSTSATATATPSSSGSGTQSPVVTPTLAVCVSSQLTVERGLDGVAMGHVGITGSGFKNISTSVCTLAGYPNLQMLDSSGQAIPTHVIQGTSYNVPSVAEKVVVLEPGAAALFDLGYSNETGYGTAECPASAQLEITPPNSNEPITVPWKIRPFGGPTIAKLQCGEITVPPVYASPTN